MKHHNDANELLKQDERDERVVHALRGYRCFVMFATGRWREVEPLIYWCSRKNLKRFGCVASVHLRRSFIDRVCGVGAEL